MDAANLLKPMLARGKLKVIGATTLNEYREYIEKDSAFERRFAQVIVEEPSVPDTVASEYYLSISTVRVSVIADQTVQSCEAYGKSTKPTTESVSWTPRSSSLPNSLNNT